MRRHDQPVLARLQPRKIVEAVHRFGRGAEIQQQDMSALDRPLDAGNERDAAVGCVVERTVAGRADDRGA